MNIISRYRKNSSEWKGKKLNKCFADKNVFCFTRSCPVPEIFAHRAHRIATIVPKYIKKSHIAPCAHTYVVIYVALLVCYLTWLVRLWWARRWEWPSRQLCPPLQKKNLLIAGSNAHYCPPLTKKNILMTDQNWYVSIFKSTSTDFRCLSLL